MRTGLKKTQKITEIYFSEASELITVITYNTSLKKRLLSFSEEFPELCTLVADDDVGCLTFEINKDLDFGGKTVKIARDRAPEPGVSDLWDRELEIKEYVEEKYNVEVITACVDVGQGEEEMIQAKESAAKIGGLKHYNIDAKEEFANEYIARGIKANAEYESFKSNIDNLQDLSKKSGSTISRAIGGVGNLFDVIVGKDTGITKPNDAMQELKAQLVQAIFKANGIDGYKINKEQSKIILRQAGMPDSGDLSQSQVNTIIKNIDSIYKQRIAGKKNLADSFNSVSWE